MKDKTPLIIFLADDDDDDRYIFSDALKKTKLSASLTTFEKGNDLIEALKNNYLLPDLIFLDINMPLLNGKECLKKIRANKQFDQIPVIMYSTSSNSKDIDETFKFGANLYVVKPFSFSSHKTMLKKVIELYENSHLKTADRANFLFNYED